jgi:hypothetical protein
MGKGSGFLVGKLQEKRPCVRPRSEWEDNIKMDLAAICYRGVNSIELQDLKFTQC